jgi:hypothetical protein
MSRRLMVLVCSPVSVAHDCMDLISAGMRAGRCEDAHVHIGYEALKEYGKALVPKDTCFRVLGAI